MPSFFGSPTARLSTLLIDHDLDMGSYQVKSDKINSSTAGAGVDIEGALVIDGYPPSIESRHVYDIYPMFSFKTGTGVIASCLESRWGINKRLFRIYFPYPRTLAGSKINLAFEWKSSSTSYMSEDGPHVVDSVGNTLFLERSYSMPDFKSELLEEIDVSGIRWIDIKTSTQATGDKKGATIRNVEVRGTVTEENAYFPPGGCEIV